MTFFSELGYGSLPDLVDNNGRFEKIGNPIVPPTVYHRRLAEEHRRALKESGCDRIYPDLRKFCLDQQRIHGIANKRMIEAVRCNPAVIGYCIHALTAGDWIIGAGLLDLFRNPKTYAYEGTKAANHPRILPIRVRPRNIYADRGAEMDITGVNEREAVKGNLTVEVVSKDGDTAFAKKIRIDMPSGISRLFSGKLDTRRFEGAYTVKARVTADDGSLIAENDYGIDVFSPALPAIPGKRIAVLCPGGRLKPFLKRAGIEFVEFKAGTDRTLPVFISRTAAGPPDQKKLFAELIEWIKAGGTAVYLQGFGARVGRWGKSHPLKNPLVPLTARSKIAVGHWTCIPHVVSEHPVFDGLPRGCMMGPVYENIWALDTLMEVGGEAIVASIGFDWFPDYDSRKRHYYGPGDTWWGADMASVPVGKGRCVVSQLRLLENLGKDPVADRILFNLVRWTTSAREQK
jgi:hypothetical protein